MAGPEWVGQRITGFLFIFTSEIPTGSSLAAQETNLDSRKVGYKSGQS